jgi:hypothetical protein
MDSKPRPSDRIKRIPPEKVAIREHRGGVYDRPVADDDFPIGVVLVRRALRKVSRGRWGGVAELPKSEGWPARRP